MEGPYFGIYKKEADMKKARDSDWEAGKIQNSYRAGWFWSEEDAKAYIQA